MKILITGSTGHLGEALIRTYADTEHTTIGLDIKPSPFTSCVGSIANRSWVRDCMVGVDAVIHTATLHKPHVATHTRHAFVETNVTGTLNLLEEAVAAGVGAFVYTSTTSAFGDALRPVGAYAPAIWVDESLRSQPKNIYGATKTAAEDLCQLFARNERLPCVVLRTSRFFPEDDDDRSRREEFNGDNLKANELLCRRADIADIVTAHQLAIGKAGELGFERLIISATTPFRTEDLRALTLDAEAVVRLRVPPFAKVYEKLGWSMLPRIERVYDNARARQVLGWRPRHDFLSTLQELDATGQFGSALARSVGIKGYHDVVFDEGPYPVC